MSAAAIATVGRLLLGIDTERTAARAIHRERSWLHRWQWKEPEPIYYCVDCMALVQCVVDAVNEADA